MVSEWKVSSVRVESKQPLVVALDGPIDGRDADYLAIVNIRDRRVAGRAQLTNGESTWTFTPSAPWRPGPYKLVVRGTLEDPAGNRLGSHFETSIYSPPGAPVDTVVPFAVRFQAPRRPLEIPSSVAGSISAGSPLWRPWKDRLTASILPAYHHRPNECRDKLHLATASTDIAFEPIERFLSILADLDEVAVRITHIATPFPAVIV